MPLVQALADGRVIQHQKTDGTWIDEIEFSFDWPAHRYRVNPVKVQEEIDVLVFPSGQIQVCNSRIEAVRLANHCISNGGSVEAVTYAVKINRSFNNG